MNNAIASGGGGGSYGGSGSTSRIAVYYYTSWSGNFSPGYVEHLGVTNTPTPTANPVVTNTATPTAMPAGWYTNSYTYSSTIPHAVTSVDRVNYTDTFTYDENGNMTCRVESGVTYLQTYSAGNRIASIVRLASGTCSAPGNYKTKWDFTYDGDGTRTATLTTPYDANGQPQTASVTRYFFGGSYETSGSTVKKYYSFAGQTIAMKDGTVLQYFLTDHLGSVVTTLDSTGTLISQQRYLPFGAPRSVPNSPIVGTDLGYTGQRLLDSGMGGIMDYKARFYSPYLNQFTQPDSIVPNPSNPQDWNRYAYARNNPVRYNDPTGHWTCDDEDANGNCINYEQIEKRVKNKQARLKRELDNYPGLPTVSPDKMVTIGTPFVKWLFDVDPQSISPQEYKLLGGPQHFSAILAYQIGQIRNEAVRGTVDTFGYHGRNGITDAFRHAYGAALMTREFGTDFAESFTTAHETQAGSVREEQFMDLHNNGVGIEIATANPNASNGELLFLVAETLLKGNLYVWDGNNITYSNQCPSCFIPGQGD